MVKAGLIAFCVLFMLILATRPLPANPFATSQIEGSLVEWDGITMSGWLESNERFIPFQLEVDATSHRLTDGCRIRAQGIYRRDSTQRERVFVAEVVSVSNCPRSLLER